MAFQDNSDEVKRKFHEAMKKAGEVVGGMLETNRKKNITEFKWQHKTANSAGETFHAAIDTGLLRNSITYAVSGKEANTKSYKADKGGKSGTYKGSAPEEAEGVAVYLGTNVEYAPEIELGSRKNPAVHFLSDTINKNQDQYKKAIEKIIVEEMN